MTLLQATGVIMGANIGTTITAQLIAFNLSDVAPFILFAGMLMTVFVKKRKIARIGEIVLLRDTVRGAWHHVRRTGAAA